MATYKFLVDEDVRHLADSFPSKSTRQLEDVGLTAGASDADIVAVASVRRLIVVTNNRRDFEQEVARRVAATSKKTTGCTQVHGLVIVLPSEQFKQKAAVERASKQLQFEGRTIGWKEVNDLCLKVVIEDNGRVTVTKLPRCPHCSFEPE